MTPLQQPLLHGRLLSKCLQRYLGSLGLRAGIQRYNNGDSSAIQGNISLSISRYHWATGLAQDDPSKRLHHGKPVSTQTV